MRTSKRLIKNQFNISKYLPVFIILLSVTIILGSTFAYFTDKVERTSELTFSKVELSSETTTGINGSLRDVIPGTPLVDGALKFSKSIDSEAIYVRAKISFSLPSEYKDDADMKEMVDLLRSATDFNIVSEAQHGAVWSAKDGNYFYLVSSADNTKLMRVDTVDTYVLSDEVVVPRDLENLPGNAQYMKGVNFHIAFEAIQADNVSSVLSETKETFNVLFPENEAEKGTVEHQVTFKGFDGSSDLEVVAVKDGEVLSEPVVEIPLDENNEPMYVFDGWYSDSALTNKYEFTAAIDDSITLYPKALQVSKGLEFTLIEEAATGDGPASVGGTGYAVAMGDCSDTNVVVPSTYKGLPVIEVAYEGFYELASIKSVYLPSTITSIGDYAFRGCSNLTSISLPDNLTTIGNCLFYQCTKLVLTQLPAGVTKIDDNAFYQCANLALTSLPSGLTSIGNYVFNDCAKLAITSLPSGIELVGDSFDGCTNLLSNGNVDYLPIEGTNNNAVICGKSTSATSIDWPENVTIIAGGAFRYYSSLILTSLPSGVISIGKNAFYGCSKIALTSLPAGLTIIDESAFTDCAKLAITSLPNGIRLIGRDAFKGCTSLPSNDSVYYLSIDGTSNNVVVYAKSTSITSVSWPSNVTMIVGGAFYNCTSLASISLPENITHIYKYTFYNCTNLTLTSIPNSVTCIETYAFYECTNLALTSLPNNLTTIESVAFYECSKLALTSLPGGLTSIGVQAFQNCSNLRLNAIPNSVNRIDAWAFYGCSNITLTSLPAKIVDIGAYTFYGCSKLALTSLPAGLISIGSGAFQNCSRLALRSLPSSVTYIGDRAFQNCTLLPSNSSVYYLPIEGTSDYAVTYAKSTSITQVTWPGNVTIIAGGAFYECKNLVLASLPSDLTFIGANTFYGCENITLSSLPSGITSIGSGAFYKCRKITLTSLPSGVRSIGSYAFQWCDNLALKSLPENLTFLDDHAFYECGNLALTSLPEGLTSIDIYTFYGCSKLALKSLPSLLTEISSYAFYGCSKLALTSLPSLLTEISDYAFYGCSSLVLTSLPEGLTKIGEYAFSGCSRLAFTSFIFKDVDVDIDSTAFDSINSVKFIEIQTTKASSYMVAMTMFRNCRAMEYILCPNDTIASRMQTYIRYGSIYVLQTTGYEGGAFDTEVVINDTVTIYTAEIDGVKWVRTSDNNYYKLQYAR